MKNRTRITAAILLAVASCNGGGGLPAAAQDIGWNPPVYKEQERQLNTPAQIHEPTRNGRNNLARDVVTGAVSCANLQTAMEDSFNWASDAHEQTSGRPQPHLHEVQTEDEMHSLMNDFWWVGNADVRLNVEAAKEAFQLWFTAKCYE